MSHKQRQIVSLGVSRVEQQDRVVADTLSKPAYVSGSIGDYETDKVDDYVGVFPTQISSRRASSAISTSTRSTSTLVIVPSHMATIFTDK